MAHNADKAQRNELDLVRWMQNAYSRLKGVLMMVSINIEIINCLDCFAVERVFIEYDNSFTKGSWGQSVIFAMSPLFSKRWKCAAKNSTKELVLK